MSNLSLPSASCKILRLKNTQSQNVKEREDFFLKKFWVKEDSLKKVSSFALVFSIPYLGRYRLRIRIPKSPCIPLRKQYAVPNKKNLRRKTKKISAVAIDYQLFPRRFNVVTGRQL